MIKYTVEVDSDGTEFWHLNGKLHREDGPAIKYTDGSEFWYLNGNELTEEEFNNRHTKEMSVSEIEKLLGHKVKIIKD